MSTLRPIAVVAVLCCLSSPGFSRDKSTDLKDHYGEVFLRNRSAISSQLSAKRNIQVSAPAEVKHLNLRLKEQSGRQRMSTGLVLHAGRYKSGLASLNSTCLSKPLPSTADPDQKINKLSAPKWNTRQLAAPRPATPRSNQVSINSEVIHQLRGAAKPVR